jgi:hypothetical protein
VDVTISVSYPVAFALLVLVFAGVLVTIEAVCVTVRRVVR